MIELKTEWFGARVETTKGKKIRQYSHDSGIRLTDLVRIALDEYMVNHPVSATEPE